MRQSVGTTIKTLLCWQLSLMLPVTLIVLLLAGKLAALSLFAGIISTIILATWSAWRLFSVTQRSATAFLRKLYMLEAQKILLILLLFYAIIQWQLLNPVWFLVGFILNNFVFWLLLLIVNKY